MELRDCQIKALNHYRKKRSSTLYIMATGKGKSVLSLEIIKDRLSSDKGIILVLCPTQLIRDQLYSLYRNHIPVLIIEGKLVLNKINKLTRVFICCYPTYEILSRMEPSFLLSVSLLIIDEVHKLSRETIVNKLIRKVSEITLVTKIGLTATPGSKSNLSGMLRLLSCTEDDIYEDREPLFEKKDHIFPIPCSLWRATLLQKLREDLLQNFCNRYVLPASLAEFPFNTKPLSQRPYLVSHYLLLNKLTRFANGATPQRIKNFYENNLEKSKINFDRYLSKNLVELIKKLGSFSDQRLPFINNLSQTKRIIFVDDILMGRELKESLPDCYFIHSKERKEARAVFKILQKKKTFNLLATSMAEEGLNLSLDEVLNFQVPTTMIKLEQRKGRVGRYRKGEVFYFNILGTYGSTLLSRFISNKKDIDIITNDN